MSERLRKRLLCKRFGEMLDPNLLQLDFRQASSRIHEFLNLLQLSSPDEGLVNLYREFVSDIYMAIFTSVHYAASLK